MSNECEVSVIIPVYNAERYLRECLDSIVGQTLREIEIICVNDGSTDSSVEIIEEYIRRDSRIAILHQENGYAGIARNNGMKHSCGKYLVFWDADDIFEAEALEKLYEQCETDQADICVCEAVRFRSEEPELLLRDVLYLKEKHIPEGCPFSIADIPASIFNFTTNVPWNKMYRRRFVEEHQILFENRERANDQYFVMLALAYAKAITVVREHLIRYRINNEASLTGTLSGTPLCIYEALLNAKEALAEKELFVNEQVQQSMANRAISSLLFGMEKQTSTAAFCEIYQTLKNGGLEKFFVTDKGADYFYTIGGYRKYQAMMAGDELAYLLTEGQFMTEFNSDLKYARRQSRILNKKLKKEIKELTKELTYIKERAWYKAIVRMAEFKNRLLGKEKK